VNAFQTVRDNEPIGREMNDTEMDEVLQNETKRQDSLTPARWEECIRILLATVKDPLNDILRLTRLLQIYFEK